jgi:hypothetical protein
MNRRRFLSAVAAFPLIGRLRAGTTAIFEEIPPERSGIKWVHENARTAEHYLPETMPPGCAIFDYDNDGWMDIFFVNTGPADFSSRRLRCATRSTKTTVTAHLRM